jgi:hypothetical protein
VTEKAAETALRAASIGVHTLGSYVRGDRDRYPPALVVGYAAAPAHAYPQALQAFVHTVATLR